MPLNSSSGASVKSSVVWRMRAAVSAIPTVKVWQLPSIWAPMSMACAAPEHDERLGLVRLERRLGPCEEATGEGAPGVARRSDDRAAFEGEAQHLLAVAREPRLAAGAAGVGRGHVVLASIAPGGGVRDREPGEVEEMGALAANVGVLPDRGAPR